MAPRVPLKPAALAVILAAALAACAGRQHLGDYSFTGKRIALVYTSAPVPQLYAGEEANDGRSASEGAESSSATLRVAPVAQARFDSAAARVNFPALLASQTLDRASTALGAMRTSNAGTADFVLSVSMDHTALELANPTSPIYLVRGTATLRDARSGREIWRTALVRAERLSRLSAEGAGAGDGAPAAPSGEVGVAGYQHMLEGLARFAAVRLTEPLGSPAAVARTRVADGAVGAAAAAVSQ